MLFEKLIKQHCVDFFISDAEGLAFLIVHHEIGINLRNFFRYQTELWHSIWIKLFLVPEADWMEPQDRFACIVHRFNLFLEPAR